MTRVNQFPQFLWRGRKILQKSFAFGKVSRLMPFSYVGFVGGARHDENEIVEVSGGNGIAEHAHVRTTPGEIEMIGLDESGERGVVGGEDTVFGNDGP